MDKAYSLALAEESDKLFNNAKRKHRLSLINSWDSYEKSSKQIKQPLKIHLKPKFAAYSLGKSPKKDSYFVDTNSSKKPNAMHLWFNLNCIQLKKKRKDPNISINNKPCYKLMPLKFKPQSTRKTSKHSRKASLNFNHRRHYVVKEEDILFPHEKIPSIWDISERLEKTIHL